MGGGGVKELLLIAVSIGVSRIMSSILLPPIASYFVRRGLLIADGNESSKLAFSILSLSAIALSVAAGIFVFRLGMRLL
jgi:hypothetical protein